MFLAVARRSPWCRGTPAHVHWSLLRCPRGGGGTDCGGGGGGGSGDDGFSLSRLAPPTPPLPPLRASAPPPAAPPLAKAPTIWAHLPFRDPPTTSLPRATAAFLLRRDLHLPLLHPPLLLSPFSLLLARPCPRYYHSVLLAIYRPLSTVPPVNEPSRCIVVVVVDVAVDVIVVVVVVVVGRDHRFLDSGRIASRTLVNQRGWLIVS